MGKSISKNARKKIKSLWQFYKWKWILTESTVCTACTTTEKRRTETKIRRKPKTQAITYAWGTDTNKSGYRSTEPSDWNEKKDNTKHPLIRNVPYRKVGASINFLYKRALSCFGSIHSWRSHSKWYVSCSVQRQKYHMRTGYACGQARIRKYV